MDAPFFPIAFFSFYHNCHPSIHKVEYPRKSLTKENRIDRARKYICFSKLKIQKCRRYENRSTFEKNGNSVRSIEPIPSFSLPKEDIEPAREWRWPSREREREWMGGKKVVWKMKGAEETRTLIALALMSPSTPLPRDNSPLLLLYRAFIQPTAVSGSRVIRVASRFFFFFFKVTTSTLSSRNAPRTTSIRFIISRK